ITSQRIRSIPRIVSDIPPLLLSILLPRPLFFFFNDPAPTEIYTLSLHDALPISPNSPAGTPALPGLSKCHATEVRAPSLARQPRDRKSTRLNSSHVSISYAVFCLKKKKKKD